MALTACDGLGLDTGLPLQIQASPGYDSAQTDPGHEHPSAYMLACTPTQRMYKQAQAHLHAQIATVNKLTIKFNLLQKLTCRYKLNNKQLYSILLLTMSLNS